MKLTRREYIQLFGGAILAAHFGLQASEGKPLALDRYKGKLVLADFWASWCVPCKKSFPWLNQMAKKYKDSNLVVLGVNVDANLGDAENFLRQHQAEFPIVFDPAGAHAAYYNIQGMPSSVLFSREGKVVHRHVGFVTAEKDQYEAAIVKALKL